MAIPKVIHYCWFGGNPLPKDVKRCIQSWKKFCPEYKIIEWNENNFDCTQSLYAQQALENRRWAFVSDYARLKIIYDQGGIYLDTDVELIRPLDDLLDYQAFFGFENNQDKQGKEVATGLGFGAEKGNAVVKELLKDYEGVCFQREDGSQDWMPCPKRNTATLVRLGLRQDGTRQTVAGAEIFPSEYFCPIEYQSNRCEITENTYSIHHYHASWLVGKKKIDHYIKKHTSETFYLGIYRPVRCGIGAMREKLAKKLRPGK